MNEIDLRRFDLNLLIVFEVLMTERSVSRAAERLGRTQSAVSHSLSRLRSEAPGVSAEWTAPREPTLLDVAEGQIDVAIVPAELRLPEGVAGESLGALGWRCYGRKKHPAFARWNR